jgi:hypothetical protein
MQGSTVTFPEELVGGEEMECLLSTGRQVQIRTFRAGFRPCAERPTISLDKAYSARPLVLVDKQATFPEIALLGLFRKNGWQGAWVDQHHHKYFDKMPNQSKGISLSTYVNQVVTRIAESNDRSRVGCWDLILWEERAVLFVAVVGADAPDGIGEARTRWLAAALHAGMSSNQFIVVEWEHRTVVVKRKPRPAT